MRVHAGELNDEDVAVADDGFAADEAMRVRPGGIDVGVRRHAGSASLRSPRNPFRRGVLLVSSQVLLFKRQQAEWCSSEHHRGMTQL